MKKNILTALFTLSLFAIVQGQITVDPPVIFEEFELMQEQDQEFVGYAEMINGSNDPVTYVWEREIIYLPDGWETAFCDKNRCYLPFVSTQTVTLEGGERGTSDVHIYTRALPGDSAIVKMTIYEEGNPDNKFEAIYTFMNSMITSSDDVEEFEPSIKLYPNPASEVFYIDTDSDFDKVVLYSLVGKQVKTYPSNQGVYSIEGLPSGMYLARVVSREGKVLKTFRMHKR
jgi:hypothetical protein